MDNFVTCSMETGEYYDMFIDSLRQVPGVYWAEPYYLMEGDVPSPVGGTFFACFDPTLSQFEIDSINATYSVFIKKHLYETLSIYLLQNTNISGRGIIDLANEYHLRSDVIFAHPNFGTRIQRFSYKLYDYYSPYQDHIKKVIGDFNERTVWDFTGTDREVVVAVIDDRVIPHEDLPESRILPVFDLSYHTVLPNYDLAHGQACAGIIAASHTTDSAYSSIWCPWTGIISMNPHAKIMPIQIFEGAINYDTDWGRITTVSEALHCAYVNGAEVISNSYGWSNLSNLLMIDTMIMINYADGRNGKGTPVIFAAGNSADDYTYGICYVAYPARIPYAFAVGAIDLDDERWWYSQYCPELDVVAPSGDVNFQGDVWTLDYSWDYGVNPYFEENSGFPVAWNCPNSQNNDRDYNCHFGGTSAAAPIVAGIASLLIARDSTLTVDEIYDIIRYSAVTDLESGPITAPDVEYGYGRADAFRAMLAITRGDANNDGTVNVGDAVYINQYSFLKRAGARASCADGRCQL